MTVQKFSAVLGINFTQLADGNCSWVIVKVPSPNVSATEIRGSFSPEENINIIWSKAGGGSVHGWT